MCSPNLRSVSLSLSHSNCRSCQCKPIEDGGLRLVSAFLILLAHERSSNVIFLVLLAQKNLVTIFFSKIFCSSCAGEFSRHFVCGKSLHGTVFFFHGKKFLTKKIFFEDFFPEVGKPSTEISRENKNCGFPQKCGRLEALLKTITMKKNNYDQAKRKTWMESVNTEQKI